MGCLKTGEWFRESWPKFILENKKVRGIQYGRKLTLLEGFTSLQAAYTWAKQGQEQGGRSLNCDNIGFYWAFRNGSSKDDMVYTISKALNALADGLGIVIQVSLPKKENWAGGPGGGPFEQGRIKASGVPMATGSPLVREAK